MFSIVRFSIYIGIVLLIAACGGGGGGDTNNNIPTPTGTTGDVKTGVLIDSPVAGMSYQTTPGNKSGVTNAKGEYDYLEGDTVIFSIGDITFPSVTAAEVVTPLMLAGSSDLNNQVVINISRLLQTLDSDPNDDVITITSSVLSAGAGDTLDFDVPTNVFETNVNDFLLEAIGTSVMVSVADAVSHLQSTIAPTEFSTEWLSSKTLYLVWFGIGEDANDNEINDVPVVVKGVFNNDGTVTGTGLLNSTSGTSTYGVTSSGELFFEDETNSLNTIDCVKEDYIVTEYSENGIFDNVDLFFFDESAAMDYANSLSASIPRSLCDMPGAVRFSDYFNVGNLGDSWTYKDSNDNQFTWTLSEVATGPNAGRLRLGDDNSWVIYEVIDNALTIYEIDNDALATALAFSEFYTANQQYSIGDEGDAFVILSEGDSSSITLPAGTFSDVIILVWLDTNFPPNSVNEQFNLGSLGITAAVTDVSWYVGGIGDVKYMGVDASTGLSDGNDYELVSTSLVGSTPPPTSTLACSFESDVNESTDQPEPFNSYTDFQEVVTACGGVQTITAADIVGTWKETWTEGDVVWEVTVFFNFNNTFSYIETADGNFDNSGNASWSVTNNLLTLTDNVSFIDVFAFTASGQKAYTEEAGWGANISTLDGTSEGEIWTPNLVKQ